MSCKNQGKVQIVSTDFSGCDADIAKVLKDNPGAGVLCEAWDDSYQTPTDFICFCYSPESHYPYIGTHKKGDDTAGEVIYYKHASIKRTIYHVKSEVDLLRLFIKERYTVNDEGDYRKPDADSPYWFYQDMFESCGKVPPENHMFRDEWLEAVD